MARLHIRAFAWRVVAPITKTINWLDAHNGLISALATIAIAVLTYYLAVYAGGQENILNRQIVDAHTTQRAFIGAHELEFETFYIDERKGEGNKPLFWRITMAIENSGSTPTRNAVLFIASHQLIVSSEPDETELDMSSYESMPIVVGPKSKINAFDWYMTPDMYADITKGTKNYYVRGMIKYNDIFSSTETHITKFCFRVYGMPWPDWAPKEILSDVLKVIKPNSTLCARNNCTDGECAVQ